MFYIVHPVQSLKYHPRHQYTLNIYVPISIGIIKTWVWKKCALCWVWRVKGMVPKILVKIRIWNPLLLCKFNFPQGMKYLIYWFRSYILGALQSDSTLPFQIDKVKDLLQMEITSWSRHHDWILDAWEERTSKIHWKSSLAMYLAIYLYVYSIRVEIVWQPHWLTGTSQ